MTSRRQWEVYRRDVLLRKIETARSLTDLQLYGEEAKTAPEPDKPKLREAYAERLRELKISAKGG